MLLGLMEWACNVVGGDARDMMLVFVYCITSGVGEVVGGR